METHPPSHTFYWVCFGEAMKKCNRCSLELPLDLFYKNTTKKDGLQNLCINCCKRIDSQRVRKYNSEIQARYKDKRAERYLKNKNLEVKKAYNKTHYANNKEHYFARAILRANKIRQSSICKADIKNVAGIYKKASIMRAQGLPVEVDHIVPLNGKNVSGLHVSWNLQIIPISENRTKSNKY